MLGTPRTVGVRFLWSAAAAREIGGVPLAVIEPGVPIISAPNPTPGDFSTDREADRRTRVEFTYQRQNASALPMLWCRVGFEWFVIYDGTSFVGIFDGFCTVEQASENEFHFSILPAGGWWGSVEIHGGDVVEAGLI